MCFDESLGLLAYNRSAPILMSFQSAANLRDTDPAMAKLKKSIDHLVQVEDQLKELLGSEETTENGVAQNSCRPTSQPV